MGLSSDILAIPSPVHIEAKCPDVVVTPLVGRKGSFRGFSASSLSSLTLGRGQSIIKRNSAGMARKSVNFIMSGFKDQDAELLPGSRPPSLMTDDGSHTTSISSRSPSPEPARTLSRLEMAYQNYSTTNSPTVLNTVLLPILTQARRDEAVHTQASGPRAFTSRKTSLTVAVTVSNSMDGYLLEESDINILFKWWNHLLLLSTPTTDTCEAIYAIAFHPSLRSTIFWNAHYELTLSTILSLPAAILPSTYFAKLIALGYIYHQPTFDLLRNLFVDPTKVNSSEPWIKRVKNVEALVETIKHVYSVAPDFDDGSIMEARLEELLGKVINVTTYPNPRLVGLMRLIGSPSGVFATKVEDCLVRIAGRIGVFEFSSTFFLLDVLSSLVLERTQFWLVVLERIIATENHVLQIRAFSFLYQTWDTFRDHQETIDMLISPPRWEYFFTHWSGIVRDHFMRLISYKVCLDRQHEVRSLLVQSFQTSLLENCQLRDCLPSNPIPNKRFVIRPVNNKSSAYRPQSRAQRRVSPLHDQQKAAEEASPAPTPPMNAARRKLGFLRGLWSEDNKDELRQQSSEAHPSTRQSLSQEHVKPALNRSETARLAPTLQRFRFVPEFVGKQWSLTTDDDAIQFLDTVMDAARNGRLPLYACNAASIDVDTEVEESSEAMPFILADGRKQLWTRSLSEWSVLLDDADRFWKTCGGRTLVTTNGVGSMHCPDLEVEFPRWFVQRSTQVAGDGIKEI